MVPIIENTARECELTERLQAAIRAYPRTRAVLVRRHGVYVWGRDWIQAKTQAECYEYLFEAAVRLRQLGLDASRPAVGVEDAGRPGAAPLDVSAPGPKRAARGVPRAVVLDIEGTVAPISYVTATLFPYARVRLRSHLEASWGTPATQAVVQQLRQQVRLAVWDVLFGGPGLRVSAHVLLGMAGGSACGHAGSWVVERGRRSTCRNSLGNVSPGPPSPPAQVNGSAIPGLAPAAREGDAAEEVAAVAAWAAAEMDADRKTPALKTLQGHIWTEGFATGELTCPLFPDVAPALRRWAGAGIKLYIYSSGSRWVQGGEDGPSAGGWRLQEGDRLPEDTCRPCGMRRKGAWRREQACISRLTQSFPLPGKPSETCSGTPLMVTCAPSSPASSTPPAAPRWGGAGPGSGSCG